MLRQLASQLPIDASDRRLPWNPVRRSKSPAHAEAR